METNSNPSKNKQSKTSELVEFARLNLDEYKEINYSVIPNFQAQIIAAQLGIQVRGALKIISTNGIRHVFESHYDVAKEELRGQVAVVDSDFDLIPTILSNPDEYSKGDINNRRNKHGVVFMKKIRGLYYYVVMTLTKTGGGLELKTMYKRKQKSQC